jgi:ketosteroid isomerase-like protein
MRGRTSGIELEWNFYAQVWTIRDAKVVRMEFFPTRGEALEAVGRSSSVRSFASRFARPS